MEDLKVEPKLQLNHIGMKASTMIHGLLKEKTAQVVFGCGVLTIANKLSFAVIVITVVHKHSFFMLLFCKHVFANMKLKKNLI